MDTQTKRTLLATVLCLVILIGWIKVQEIFYPPPPPSQTTSGPAGLPGEADEADEWVSGEITTPDAPPSQSSESRPSESVQPPGSDAQLVASEFTIPDAPESGSITLGDDRATEDNPYQFAVVVTQRGAGVEAITLAHHRNKLADSKEDPGHDPYDLLAEIDDPTTHRAFDSFVTKTLKIAEDQKKGYREIDLSGAVWSIEKRSDSGGESVVLTTTVKKGGADLFSLEKTYRLNKADPHHLEVSVNVRNLSSQPYETILTQGGPVGVKKEDYRYEFRKVVTAVLDEEGIMGLGRNMTIDDVDKADDAGRRLAEKGQSLRWVSLSNKYFGCIVVPKGADSEQIGDADGDTAVLVGGVVTRCFSESQSKDDLTFDMAFRSPDAIQPGREVTLTFDAFCGPKSKSLFDTLPKAEEHRYDIIQSADSRWCTFEIITKIMLWLLTHIYGIVGNYGIAIIILVFIVRIVLHPVTKRGQVNMMKMQTGMAKLKPKIDAVQQQHKNDRQKLNEETMRIYKEEGVNPAGQIFGCLPMFLQMPIWVALWTMLNSNVDMRHQPFFSWITDLSAPDSLIPFNTEYDIPLIGAMMGPIAAFNLLPLIMTATMYAQQKITQKFTKPATPAAPKLDKDGNPMPDTMAQQQKMMSFMMIFFGFIFYNFPSGLNLYILTSNILGILEQYHIKKQLREKEERGELEFAQQKKPAPGKMSMMQRMGKMAEDAKRTGSGRGDIASKKRKG